MKFQYNKTALQDLDKQLKVRVRALPTIKNKENAASVNNRIMRQVFNQLLLRIRKSAANICICDIYLSLR